MKIPIVILVNDQSASASEIMAGCLQDLGRAKIAGVRSYGKGTVQKVFELENDQTALKFTTAKFYRPSGGNIHRSEKMNEQDEWGVTPEPELVLPITETQELYLNRRWYLRGDPRITTATDQAPSPQFAGDPQLRVVVEYLQRQLGSEVSEGQPESPSAAPTDDGSSTKPTPDTAQRENGEQADS